MSESGQTDSKTVNVQVRQASQTVTTIYFGNSDTILSDAESIKELSSTTLSKAEDTYDKAYYYIAVLSSKNLKSIINRGVEPVTENFVLKDNNLTINASGNQLTYKLYECDINSYADSGDMDTYILTITIE